MKISPTEKSDYIRSVGYIFIYVVAIGGSAFLLLLLILGYGFQIREITALLQRLSRRLNRRG